MSEGWKVALALAAMFALAGLVYGGHHCNDDDYACRWQQATR